MIRKAKKKPSKRHSSSSSEEEEAESSADEDEAEDMADMTDMKIALIKGILITEKKLQQVAMGCCHVIVGSWAGLCIMQPCNLS